MLLALCAVTRATPGGGATADADAAAAGAGGDADEAADADQEARGHHAGDDRPAHEGPEDAAAGPAEGARHAAHQAAGAAEGGAQRESEEQGAAGAHAAADGGRAAQAAAAGASAPARKGGTHLPYCFCLGVAPCSNALRGRRHVLDSAMMKSRVLLIIFARLGWTGEDEAHAARETARPRAVAEIG